MKKPNRINRNPLAEPYKPKQARRVANKEAQAEYGPTIRAARQQKAGSAQRQKQVGEWFTGLQGQIGQAAQETDQSYQMANNAMIAHANAAAAAAQQTQGQILANNTGTASLTGADPSLFQKTNAEGAAAANQRQIALSALSAPIAQAGASQAGYLRTTGINTAREGIQQKQNEQKRRDTITEDITGLRKERAGKALGNFNTIRDKEFEKRVQAKAFNLQGKEFKQGQYENEQNRSENAADRGLREREIKNNERGGGGKNGRTPSQIRADRREWKSVTAAAPDAYSTLKAADAEGKPGEPSLLTAANLAKLIVKETGAEYAIAKKAAQRYLKRKHSGAGAAQGLGGKVGL